MLKVDVDCLCEAFKSSVQFGVVLNITKLLPFLTVDVSHLTLLCLFLFAFWKISSCLVARKIRSFGISARNFFVVIDGSFVFS